MDPTLPDRLPIASHHDLDIGLEVVVELPPHTPHDRPRDRRLLLQRPLRLLCVLIDHERFSVDRRIRIARLLNGVALRLGYLRRLRCEAITARAVVHHDRKSLLLSMPDVSMPH